MRPLVGMIMFMQTEATSRIHFRVYLALMSLALFSGCNGDDPIKPPIVQDAGIEVVLNAATDPTPTQGRTDVMLNASLQWQGDDQATAYRVYFGPTATSVAGMTDDTLVDNTDATTSEIDAELETAQTYYWRVVTLGLDQEVVGPLWSFTTLPSVDAPGVPTAPTPANAAVEIAVDTSLTWDTVERADSYTVYFGDNPSAVVAGEIPIAQSTPDTTAQPPQTLVLGQTYYWRVVAHNGSGSTMGPLWSFVVKQAQMPGNFSQLSPTVRELDVSVDASLTWTASENAALYTVFLSTQLVDVVTGSADGFGAQIDGLTWTPDSTLAEGTMYYWRVEAKNEHGITTAFVSSFRTAFPVVPQVAHTPLPNDLAEEVELDTALEWMGDAVTADYDVYLGLDALSVQLATRESEEFMGNTETSQWLVPNSVGYAQTWYWRVDARNISGTTLGALWTFTTDGETNPPTFRGVESALALDNALHVRWTAGTDDDDLSNAIVYSVFVWAADNRPNWDTPIEDVQNITSLTLDRVVLGTLLDAPMVVAVRSRDSEGRSNLNTVQIQIPSTAGLTRIYVGPGDAGDGTLEAPFNDLNAAFSASTDGAVVFVSPGRYNVNGAAIPASESPLVVVGGVDFQEFAEVPTDTEVLNAWQPSTARPTLYREETPGTEDDNTGAIGEDVLLSPPQTSMITMEGSRWASFSGLRFEDPDNQTIEVNDSILTITGCYFTQLDDADPQQTRAFGTGSSILGTANSGAFTGWLVGNHLENLYSFLVLSDEVNSLHVSNNLMLDLESQALKSGLIDVSDNGESDDNIHYPWLVPAAGSMVVHIEANTGHRLRGMTDVVFGAMDQANGGAIELTIRGNAQRGIPDTWCDIDALGDFGAGGSARVDVRDNHILGVSGDFLELSIAPEELNTETDQTFRGDSDGPVTIIIEDNHFLHGNSDAVEVRDAHPGGHIIDFQVRRNFVLMLESEGFGFRTNTSNRPTQLIGGQVNMIAEDNQFNGPDGAFEIYSHPILGGQTNLTFRRNQIAHDHDYGHRINFFNYEASTNAPSLPWDRSITIDDSSYSGEDQLAWINMMPTYGDTAVSIQRNSVVSAGEGVRFVMQDPAEDGNDIVNFEGGTFSLQILDNRFVSEEQCTDLELISYQDFAEVRIDGNQCTSFDDAFELTLYDFDRLIGSNNQAKAYGNDSWNTNIFFKRVVDKELDVMLFNNTFRDADDGTLDLNAAYDDTYPETASKDRTINFWIAHNDFLGANESEAMDIVAPADSLILVERNHIGYNDVDSSPAWDLKCRNQTPIKPFIRGRNNIFAYGAGSGIDTDTCGGQYINNTIAYNNRERAADSAIDSNTNPSCYDEDCQCPEGACFSQILGHSNIFAFNSGSDLSSAQVSQAPYSLVTRNPYSTTPGVGAVIGDPLFRPCDSFADAEDCFGVQPQSVTIDAGNPSSAWNDVDGTRNDMGAFGGPWAGPIGALSEIQTLQLALVGVKPFGDLMTGQGFVPIDSTLTAIFSVDVDADSIDAGLSVVDATGQTVAGTWFVSRNRAVFTVDGSFVAGGVYRLLMRNALRGTNGETPWAEDWVQFTTVPAQTAEVEGMEDIIIDAVFAYDGSVKNIDDPSDMYTVNVNAGDRLQLSVVSARLANAQPNADLGLRLWNESGDTLLDADTKYFATFGDLNSDSLTSAPWDPYIDHVFTDAGTVVIEVYTEDNFVRDEYTYCGDTVIDDGEQCDGGVRCNQDCTIITTDIQEVVPGDAACDDVNTVCTGGYFCQIADAAGTCIATACNNGTNDDGDTLVDAADPGCANEDDNDESDDPAVLPQCANGIDDDGNQFVDYRDQNSDGVADYNSDPFCRRASDDIEGTNEPQPQPYRLDGMIRSL